MIKYIRLFEKFYCTKHHQTFKNRRHFVQHWDDYHLTPLPESLVDRTAYTPGTIIKPAPRRKIPVQYWEEITPDMVLAIDSYSAMKEKFGGVPIVNDGNRRFFIHTI